jgi:hypothetical protein
MLPNLRCLPTIQDDIGDNGRKRDNAFVGEAKGLPLGIQLVAKPGRDESLIAAALWVEQRIV